MIDLDNLENRKKYKDQIMKWIDLCGLSNGDTSVIKAQMSKVFDEMDKKEIVQKEISELQERSDELSKQISNMSDKLQRLNNFDAIAKRFKKRIRECLAYLAIIGVAEFIFLKFTDLSKYSLILLIIAIVGSLTALGITMYKVFEDTEV